MGAERIMRVTVRGRFGNLSNHAREYLNSNQDQHAVHKSKSTSEGTLTYDSLIDFFSIRYEIRLRDGDADSLAAHYAMGEAGLFLRTMAFGYRDLGSSMIDMGSVWGRRDAGDTGTGASTKQLSQ
jgi:hypothetical protein